MWPYRIGMKSSPMAASSSDIRTYSKRAGAQVFLAGGYAWLLTVLPAVNAETGVSNHGWGTVGLALIGLVSLAVGSVMHAVRSRLAPWFGVWGFVGSSTAIWVLHHDSLALQHFDPLRGTLGAMVWGLFALGWGRPWAKKAPNATKSIVNPSWTPRNDVPFVGPGALIVATAAVVCAIVIAWRPSDSTARSLVGQSLALAVGVALLTTSAQIISLVGAKRSTRSLKNRLGSLTGWTLAWLILIGIGLWWILHD